MLISVNLQTRD